ncbi:MULTISPECIES: hypothetical protein [Rhizobium]|uniref:Uncharacterized protein n=1 Tax=Rhizobium favelukesii TaxID=348824 RepID=W6RIG4_9HYPH|nr:MULTISPECIES: hypothetical protein [Rhizobium]MCS0460290.1 hypothetical protein [Rhizobium favelukesii]UFS85396.1 hypothetical protein LPB79_37885 [Rhizobium sp. T136]CDM60654.1 hypothetical protein LPU83_pLPU83c_0092 [Rhizobium favelukesii]
MSVRMATDGSLDHDGAVLRAKELMVQLAVLGTENDKDLKGEGNGNEQGSLEDEQPFLEVAAEGPEEGRGDTVEASDPVSVINPTGSRD